jgi:hypothetical protein
MSKKYLCEKEELTCRRMIYCTSETQIINLGENLEEFKDKWKYKVKKMQKLLVFKYELIV